MRVRTLKVNPKTNEKELKQLRKKHNDAVFLFEQRRDIDGFLVAVKEKLRERQSNINQLQIELKFNPKTIYRWFDGAKQPSQASQKLVCEYLGIPYYALALTPNAQGEFPCGLRLCSSCGREFALFKNSNYMYYRCIDCKNNKLTRNRARFSYEIIKNDWCDGVLTIKELADKLLESTGQSVSWSGIYHHFTRAGIPRKKIHPCKA